MNTATMDYTHQLFEPMRLWTESDTGNWNVLLGMGLAGILIGIILLAMGHKLVGTVDERSNTLYLKAAYVMLGGIVLSDLVLPKEYMWQIFFLFKYGISFMASGVYLCWAGRKSIQTN